MSQADSRNLFAVVLAAGAATRFGATKQLAEIDGETLVRRALTLAEGVCENRYLLVLGHDAAKVHAAAQPLSGFIVINEHYREGLASSLERGITALPAAAGAALVLLCDQPFVSTADLQRLVTSWQKYPEHIAACRYGDSIGVPAIFPRRLFPRLRGLSGDAGARGIIAAELPSVSLIDCPAAGQDIDRQGDLPDR